MDEQRTAVESCVESCVDELMKLFDYHYKYEPDTLNEYILKRKPISELNVELKAVCSVCFQLLNNIVSRYRIAPIDERIFIESDVIKLGVLLFKPYFTVQYWINDVYRKYDNISSEYKFEHGIIDNDAPDDIYNSIIVYLKDFVINMSI